jgi:hypothetical protein
MAAPKFSPVAPTDDPRAYASPEHVPGSWKPERPGEVEGFQPAGPQLGSQGPDQGYALHLATLLLPDLKLPVGDHTDDVVRGCVAVALRRASMFSRAPVIHDLTIAFTIWGYLDDHPPAELVAMRQPLFEGLRMVGHHYTELRTVADIAPESTLRMTPAAVAAAYPSQWRQLLGG